MLNRLNQILDELDAERKRRKVASRVKEIKRNASPDAENIAYLYEKYSLMNIEYSLSQRRRIRGLSDE